MGNKGGRRAMRIGIDVRYVRFRFTQATFSWVLLHSGWMYRATYRHGHTKNPELAALYARCARLLLAPFLPVFVFDGPGRPGRKRNKKVRGTENWLVSDVKEMLDGFGFPWVQVCHEQTLRLQSLAYDNPGSWGSRSSASLDVLTGHD